MNPDELASAMSWRGVGRRMPADWTLVAVDLRGRGYSNTLPRPYGMDQHVADVAAVLRHFAAQRPVLVGHSMGAYVALLTADAYPELTRKLVLLDGGLASPVSLPAGADLDAVLDAGLGPSIARLKQVFPSADAYVEFFRQHPALGPHWTDDVEAYVRYDVQPAPSGDGVRSRAVEEAGAHRTHSAAHGARRAVRRATRHAAAGTRRALAGPGAHAAAAAGAGREPLHAAVRLRGRGRRHRGDHRVTGPAPPNTHCDPLDLCNLATTCLARSR